MSSWSEPRFGTDPRPGENERVSEVRLSSRTLSEVGTGMGSGVGVAGFCGRKIVLKPLPVKVPAKPASAPSVGGASLGAAAAIAAPGGTVGTSWILKLLGTTNADSRRSAIGQPPKI